MWEEGAKGEDEESDEDSEEESSEDETEKPVLTREERRAAAKAKKEAAIARKKTKVAQPGDMPSSDEDSEEDSEDDDMPANPNHSKAARSQAAAAPVSVEEAAEGVKNMSVKGGKKPVAELSRREREALQAQQAKERYQKLHEAGKTDEAKADLARLKLIKEKREAEAARKQVRQICCGGTKKMLIRYSRLRRRSARRLTRQRRPTWMLVRQREEKLLWVHQRARRWPRSEAALEASTLDCLVTLHRFFVLDRYSLGDYRCRQHRPRSSLFFDTLNREYISALHTISLLKALSYVKETILYNLVVSASASGKFLASMRDHFQPSFSCVSHRYHLQDLQ